MGSDDPIPSVELIAHRAGNRAGGVTAFGGRADIVELDVRVERGELVVRHPRRVWFTSRLWEREGGWHLLPRDTPVPTLAEALVAVTGEAPDAGVWLDCKGIGRRTPRRALAQLRTTIPATDSPATVPVTVSSKAWWMLGSVGPQAGGPGAVRIIRSISNRLEMALATRLPSRLRPDGVVIHSRLLSAPVVTKLEDRFGAVFSWSIPDVATGERLAGWGVDGLIVDAPEVLAELDRRRDTGPPPRPPTPR